MLTNQQTCVIIHSMAVTKRSEGYPIQRNGGWCEPLDDSFKRLSLLSRKCEMFSSVSRECPVSAKELSDSKAASGNSRCNLSGTAEKFFRLKDFSLRRIILLYGELFVYMSNLYITVNAVFSLSITYIMLIIYKIIILF